MLSTLTSPSANNICSNCTSQHKGSNQAARASTAKPVATKGQRIRMGLLIPILAFSLFATFANAESAYAQRVTNNGRDRRPNREVPINYPNSRQSTNSQTRHRNTTPNPGYGNPTSQTSPSLATRGD